MGFLKQFFTWWSGQTLGTRFFTWRKGEHVGNDEAGNRYYRAKSAMPDSIPERRAAETPLAPALSVVVPVYNSLATLPELVERLELTGLCFGLHRADRALEFFDLDLLALAQVSHHRLERVEEVDELVTFSKLARDLQAACANVTDLPLHLEDRTGHLVRD